MSYESPQHYEELESPPKIMRQKNIESMSQGISPKKLEFGEMDIADKDFVVMDSKKRKIS